MSQMTSCQRCRQTSNGPQAFLLTCRGCSKTWHHRCHMPPVEDAELIQRIRATNAGSTVDNLSDWACRRCRKRDSETPSTRSSRELTASTEPSVVRRSLSYNRGITSPSAPKANSSVVTTDFRVKHEPSVAFDVRPLEDQERNKKAVPQEVPPMRRPLVAKTARSIAASQAHVQSQSSPAQLDSDADVDMEDGNTTGFIPQEKERPPQRPSFNIPSNQGKSARKLPSIVPATSSEDDVEMKAEISESTPLATPRASRAPSSDNRAIRPESASEMPPYVRAASLASEGERDVRPADGTEIQRQDDQDVANEAIDDDPEDLYGPPVERRIVRILPSLAEELREQQRQVAVEKEKRRAPLAPDWILARHAHDPLWKEIPTQGRRRRKATSRRLGDNGLNVSELMSCFTVQNWVREHKI